MEPMLPMYIKHLESNGKSVETVKDYEKSINAFLNFLEKLYSQDKEYYNINPSDIKGFLKSKLDAGNEIRTVNKHLTILKGFFDYLWSVGKVQVDPAAKIRRFKEEPEKPNFITYEMLLEALPQILHNPDYSTLRKTIYILALKGIRFSDYVLPKGNVIDKDGTVDIYLKKRVITLMGIEADIFLTHFFDAQFNSSDYVFVTKKRISNSDHSNIGITRAEKDNTPAVVPVEVMSIYTHLNAISEDYNFPAKLSLNLIRHAYANYLYTQQKMVIEEIAMLLGIENESAANLVRISQDRYMKGKELLEMAGSKVVR